MGKDGNGRNCGENDVFVSLNILEASLRGRIDSRCLLIESLDQDTLECLQSIEFPM